MMQITLNLPDDLVSHSTPLEDKLPQILQLGLRELNAGAQVGFTGAAEVLEFLAKLPSPEEIIVLRPSEALQTQISALLEKNRTQGLTADEEQTWQQYQYLEHLVRIQYRPFILRVLLNRKTELGDKSDRTIIGLAIAYKMW